MTCCGRMPRALAGAAPTDGGAAAGADGRAANAAPAAAVGTPADVRTASGMTRARTSVANGATGASTRGFMVRLLLASAARRRCSGNGHSRPAQQMAPDERRQEDAVRRVDHGGAHA